MRALDLLSMASLVFAVPAVWCRPAWLWTVPFALFVVTGLLGGWLAPAALVSGTVLAASVRLHVTARAPHVRAAATLLLVLLALVFGFHLAPGFERVHPLSGTSLSGLSGSEALRFSADKPLLGLFLLIACRERLCRSAADWRRAFAVTAAPVMIGIAAVYAVGMGIGYVELAPTLSPLMPLLLVRNLFFTVVAEEMLFRQVVQVRLEMLWRGRRAQVLALVVTSTLFGLAHLPGGWQFGLLAALAGAVYGYAFMVSRRVEPAMAAHLALNAGRELLFS